MLDNVNWTDLINAILNVIGIGVSGIIAVYVAKTQRNVKTIHIAVNSEREAMIAEVKKLNALLRRKSKRR